MTSKQKKLRLRYSNISGAYVILKVTNSVEVNPGDGLSEKEAREFANNPQWEVEIVSHDR